MRIHRHGNAGVHIKALTTAYSTHGTSTLHSHHALKNSQVSHYSRLLKLCWLVIAQRPQPDYGSSQSPSGWLGSEYELSHCNKPHLVWLYHRLSLHRPSMQTGHLKTPLPGDCSSLSEQLWSGVRVREDERTNRGLTKCERDEKNWEGYKRRGLLRHYKVY